MKSKVNCANLYQQQLQLSVILNDIFWWPLSVLPRDWLLWISEYFSRCLQVTHSHTTHLPALFT